MSKVLIAAAVPAVLYLIFGVLPTVIVYFLVYGRRPFRLPDPEKLRGTGYEPFLPEILAAWTEMRGENSRKLQIGASDGIRLYGEFLDRGRKETVLFFHGFHSCPAMNFFGSYQRFSEKYNLLFVHERAHGYSGGKRTTLGILEQEDVLRWAEYTKTELHQDKVILYGMSMGAAAVGFASDRLDPRLVRCMILDCGYSCPEDQVFAAGRMRHIPIFLMAPADRLLRRIDQGIVLSDRVSRHLKKTSVPALFLYGTADTTVPLSDIRENYEACSSKKKLILTEGAEHTLSVPCMSRESRKEMTDFIAECMREEINESL